MFVVSTLLGEVRRFGYVVGIAGVSTLLGKFVGWIYGWHCWRKFVAESSVWVVGQYIAGGSLVWLVPRWGKSFYAPYSLCSCLVIDFCGRTLESRVRLAISLVIGHSGVGCD